MYFLRMTIVAGAGACALGACSSANGGGAGGSMPMDLTSAPTCAAGTFQLDGVVDSIDRTSSAPVGNYGIANAGNPSTLTVEFGLGGSLQLQWDGSTALGTTAPARGTLTMPASGGSAPQVFCVVPGSEIQRFDWGGKFSLTALLQAPSVDACGGPQALMPATGDLLGCYGYKAQ
jgi:hypothetical protein